MITFKSHFLSIWFDLTVPITKTDSEFKSCNENMNWNKHRVQCTVHRHPDMVQYFVDLVIAHPLHLLAASPPLLAFHVDLRLAVDRRKVMVSERNEEVRKDWHHLRFWPEMTSGSHLYIRLSGTLLKVSVRNMQEPRSRPLTLAPPSAMFLVRSFDLPLLR